MSNVMLPSIAKPLKFNQKFASGGFNIDQKSTQNRSRKRVRFEVASRCASKSILDRFRVDFRLILAPKMAEVLLWNSLLDVVRAPKSRRRCPLATYILYVVIL